MKRVIIHVGTSKTGTKALQSFLSNNRENLRGERISYYHPFENHLAYYTPGNGGFLLPLIYDRIGEYVDPEKLHSALEESRRACDSLTAADTLILSEEVLWISGFSYEKYWDALRNVVGDIWGRDIDLNIVVYLRRQDDWTFSLWKQRAKFHTHPVTTMFPDYLQDLRRQGITDYSVCIRRMEEAFGRRNIVIRRYNKTLSGENEICRDFMAALDLPWKDTYIIDRERVNDSITLAAAEATVFIRREKMDKGLERESVIKAIELFSHMDPEKNTYYPLGQVERRKLLDACKEGNSYISDRYFDGEPLFSENIDDYIRWEFDEERAEKNAKTILKLAALQTGKFKIIK